MGQECAERSRLGPLTATDQHSQPGQSLGHQLYILVEQRAGQEQHRDALLAQCAGKAFRVDQRGVVDHMHLAAVEQRTPDLEGAGIERRVGDEAQAVIGAQFDIAVVHHQAHDATVRHAHALWLTRGAGGVHHVGGAVGGRCQVQVQVIIRPVCKLQGVQVDATWAQGCIDRGHCQHEAGLAVLHHERLALGRCVQVKRHIAGRTLEHGQLGHQQGEGARQQQRHLRIRLDALGNQVACQAVGLPVEPAITQDVLAMHHGDGGGMLGRASFEQVRHAALAGTGGVCLVKREQQMITLGRVQQVHLGQRLLVIGRHRPEQPLEVTQVAAHRRLIEQRSGVVQAADQAVALFPQVQGQVELGHGAGLVDGLQLQACQRQGGTVGRLPVQADLEHGRMAQAARRTQHFHHVFERHVLVGLGLQNPVAYLAYQGLRGRCCAWVDAQGQRIDEQPDQGFELGTPPSCDRAADHHFGLAGEARQQC
ncbi:hypothetical protein EDP1_4132 [Pseudomonas putida S610]|nr:hypothetical protein EDP1_4132 [Pseudomonas putida S610]